MTDLRLGLATGIDDVGQIVASGSNAHGQEHAFLLTQLVSAPRIYRRAYLIHAGRSGPLAASPGLFTPSNGASPQPDEHAGDWLR